MRLFIFLLIALDKTREKRSKKELSPYKYRGFAGGDIVFHVISSVTVTVGIKTCDQNAKRNKWKEPPPPPFLGKRSEREINSNRSEF